MFYNDVCVIPYSVSTLDTGIRRWPVNASSFFNYSVSIIYKNYALSAHLAIIYVGTLLLIYKQLAPKTN